MFKRSGFAIVCLAVCGLCMSEGFAFSTKIWRVANEKDLLKGDLDNVVVSSAGEVMLGVRLTKINTQEIAIWSTLQTRNGQTFIGTGNRGIIYKVNNNELIEAFDSDALVITSLVEAADGTVYAGTLPDGKIVKIAVDGTASECCQLEDPYIWTLAAAPDGSIYAGTGESGKIYRISADGQSSLVFDSKEDHVLSLAVSAEGTVFAGTTYDGILYKILPGEQPMVVHDFEENEVRSLFIRNGQLHVGTNRSKTFKPKNFVARLKKSADSAQSGSEERSPFQELFDGVVYRMNLATGGPEKLFEFSKSYVISLTADNKGQILIATGDEGLVYRVREDGTYETFIDFKENQAMTLGMNSSGNLAVIGTGNSGTVYLVDQGKAQRGVYTSEVIDAQFFSQWGSLNWLGTGKLRFQTRSGNTKEPDDDWSAWSEPADGKTLSIKSPASRFLQFQATWEEDQEAILRSVSVAFLPENRRPNISQFEVRGPETDVAYHGQPPRSTDIDFNWKVDDPNGDELLSNLYWRNQKADNWLLINREGPLDKTKFTLNSATMPDGWYTFKVEVTDKKSNPQSLALKVVKHSEPILVDNRKPDVIDLTVDSELKCEVLVEDSFSNIAWFEYSIDGSEWRLIFPLDAIFDQTKETFQFSLGDLAPGVHTVTVHVLDARGNVGTRSTEFTKQIG